GAPGAAGGGGGLRPGGRWGAGEEGVVRGDRGAGLGGVGGGHADDLGGRGALGKEVADARADRTPADEHGPHRTVRPRLHSGFPPSPPSPPIIPARSAGMIKRGGRGFMHPNSLLPHPDEPPKARRLEGSAAGGKRRHLHCWPMVRDATTRRSSP